MSTKGWRKSSSITRKLLESPYEYELQQAARLLERSAVYEKELNQSPIATNPVARFTPPTTEAIRFCGNNSLAFPSSEVLNIERTDKTNGSAQWKLQTNIIGLTGSMGVLPYHYTELILKRLKEKDKTLLKFFDLFNHRTTSLFYQASTKYRLPLQYERNHLHNKKNKKNDQHTQSLLSLIGLGTDGLNNRLYTKDESLIYYSGLFTQQIRSSTGLKQILRSHFNIPVDIEEFIGQWQELVDDVRSKLPDQVNPNGRNASLGRSAMLGSRGWFAQGKIRIILGPLNSQQLKKFAPGTPALKALHELARLYVGLENDYEFILRIFTQDLPKELLLSKSSPPIVGWNTRLPEKRKENTTDDETMDIAVSSQYLM